MILRLNRAFQEARVPRPPVWRYTPAELIQLSGGDDYTVSLTLPSGVPQSNTRIALVISGIYEAGADCTAATSFTIGGLTATSRFRRDAWQMVEMVWCHLPTGRGGDTVSVVRDGTGSGFPNLSWGAFTMVLLDGMDMVTTWPTPASAGDDIDALPSYNLTMLAGALSFHGNHASNPPTDKPLITNATMVEQNFTIEGTRDFAWGYRESPSDDTALAFTSDATSAGQCQMGVAFNPTLDEAYL
jgi:hypothetical protein